MRIALIADAYPPLRTSAAVQLRDLAQEFVLQGHKLVVLVPSTGLDKPWTIENSSGVQVLRLAALRTKDAGYVRRTVGEMLLPHAMLRGFRRRPRGSVQWDGIVWYSPSIFLGPLVSVLKRSSSCRSYLILRDIFPEWAVDMGLMGRGLPYRFFKWIERNQYAVADTIGVQTPGNLPYLSEWARQPGRRLEVLQNWLAQAPNAGCRIQVEKTALAGRTIFVYAGNMGVAQGMDVILELAARMRARRNVGFLFVGRGSDATRLAAKAKALGLDNVVFHDEIEPDEVPGLLAQCHVGIVALDPRHKTHNIPGKFLTYLRAGLPVLARINPGNDLEVLIRNERLGVVCTQGDAAALQVLAEKLIDAPDELAAIRERARVVAKRQFSAATAVRQIVAALSLPAGESPDPHPAG